MAFKLGSLFDGSGGGPLAGALCGVEPCWASEVEPYPIAVTRSRFPHMKHLGDISKINGAEIEPVDIITFGSPCQDLSVAGKRAGLKHEANGDEETTRSGLFMEAVRIIKEMRDATNGEYPRYALWENVPGAFSSNKGEDFRIVCEELIKIVEPSAFMPAVPKNGWNYADSYIGDGWSLAYRVFDAQYWGVPQRRRRIHLVADFRGQSAQEVLFEREGVRGYFETGRTPWQTTAANAQRGTGANDSAGESYADDRGRGLDAVGLIDSIGGQAERGWEGDISPTLKATHYKCPPCITVPSAGFCTEHSAKARGIGYQEEVAPTLRAGVTPGCVYSVENHPADSRVDIDESGKVQTLTSRMGTGGGNVPMVMESNPVICLQGNGIDRADTAGCNGKGWREDASYTLNTIDRPAVVYAVDQGGGKSSANVAEGKSPTLCTTHGGEPAVAYGLDRASFKAPLCAAYAATTGNFMQTTEEVAPTLMARDYKDPAVVSYLASGRAVTGCLMASGYEKLGAQEMFSGDYTVIDETKPMQYIVRRLTPTECARLQGFADRWGDIAAKNSLTDEEYKFWLEVRNTHAAINGKAVKDYTPKQMLTWYNKLQTDSAEYKMWGNGIALPPALYCMQGITDALNTEEDADAWML